MKIVALGEIMMRLSTSMDNNLDELKALNIFFGGGEYNTLVNLAGLGHDTQIITTLPNNKLSERVIIEARKYNVGTNYIKFTDGRLGTYYSILGNDLLATEVIYDRFNSAFFNNHEYNDEEILQNVDLFHVSGITPALNLSLEQYTLKMIKKAKANDILVSYDSNYRAKLWSQAKAGAFLKAVLPHVDYLFIGILDMQYLLNMEIDNLGDGYKLIKDKYPNIKFIASTNREVINATHHKMQINIFNGQLYQSKVNDISVIERIGGGDVFTAGILDGILLNKEISEISNFALADLKLKHISKGDNCHISRQMVDDVVIGDSLKIVR